VTGDESNIVDILYELDADDKIVAKKSADGLLSSLDKGRPAQAVSTWVQCEDPKCMKWRKIPWYVDADLLPERFFCKDNMWNLEGNSCDAPEDDWDKDDAMVGSDGKVEGSPVNKKKFEGSLSVDEESNFRIGSTYCFLSVVMTTIQF
jgi:CW-type Zinc Finger